MNKVIAIDIDNTIFDLYPIYKQAFVGTGHLYTHPTAWNFRECYPEEISNILYKIFRSSAIYYTPILDRRIPGVINNLKKNNAVKFITSRKCDIPPIVYNGVTYGSAHYLTYKQLFSAGINASFNDIVITGHNKGEEFIKNNVDVVFDDSPIVIEECLKRGVDCVMISTDKMLYNHYLRNKVAWANNLVEAVKSKTK